MANDKKYGSLWVRDELILALYLYCQIPFAKTKANNPAIIQLAEFLGRTPSSVARKLGNFGAFDPLLAQKGIIGLAHYSKADQETWNEFYHHWDSLVEASQNILGGKAVNSYEIMETELVAQLQDSPLSLPTGPTSQTKMVMTRLYQSFFRKAVLSSYQTSCCMCRIDIPQLLVASHIKPWASNEESRTDPENGLCLCVLHDKAYDRGLMTVSTDYKISISSSIRNSQVHFVKTSLAAFEDRQIVLPSRFAPKPEYLNWHLNEVFQA